MSISIRVVDCIYGLPAVGVPVEVTRELEGTVIQQWRNHTGDDGYVPVRSGAMQGRGSYTLEFDLEGYFRKLGYAPLNSAISVRLRLASDSHHYGLSMLITPSSCITFRQD
ncbi:MAG TPA: hydroxyisourate hydrolase [Gemmatimonadales bacterium]|nr:hydroxyisourate hydrolase [Gemmatimonadales bacterium]